MIVFVCFKHFFNHSQGKKLCMCFVDIENIFDRIQRKVLEWAMRKKGIPDGLVRFVICLQKGAMTRVRMYSEYV